MPPAVMVDKPHRNHHTNNSRVDMQLAVAMGRTTRMEVRATIRLLRSSWKVTDGGKSAKPFAATYQQVLM